MSGYYKNKLELLAPVNDSMEEFLISVERRALQMTKIATGDAEIAMDLVQDAMLKLVEKYSSKSSQQWRPLFYRILNNKITDFYRRKAVKDKLFVSNATGNSDLDITDAITALARPADNPDRRMQSKQRVDRLISSLYRLPPRQKQTFMLRCWEGMNTEQTAKAMSCSQSSVKTHYSRALKALRDQLEDYRDD